MTGTRHQFYVSGTTCAACRILITQSLSSCPDITDIHVELRRKQVAFTSTSSDAAATLATRCTALLKPHGFALSLQKTTPERAPITLPILLGMVLLAGFYAAQHFSLFSYTPGPTLTPFSAGMIGVVASFSSCLAVVGGLVLSLSAQASSDGATARAPVYFHAGRVGGFFLFGAVLGRLGEAMAINFTVASSLGVAAALVMIVLGLNLLGLFHAMPGIGLHRHLLQRLTRIEHGVAGPLLVGATTFFLPCGFTQSMQVAALASGSMLQGALIMGFFAIGTLPVLGLLSLGSFRFAHSRFAAIFLPTAGVVALGFGLVALLTSLTALGILPPLLTF